MARSERRSRYIIEYVANLGPIKKLIELQARFNASIRNGSSQVRNFGATAKATFSAISLSLSALTSAAGRIGGIFSGMSTKIRNALVTTRFEVSALGAALGYMLKQFVTGGIKAAADAEEIFQKFKIAFSQTMDEAQKRSEQLQKDFRISRITSENYLSMIQDLLVGFGMTQKEAIGLSDGVTRLALDLAEWNNIPFDTAMKNMMSGLVGNHTALRRMRIVLTQDVLMRKAQTLGITKNWKQIDAATKVYLRYLVAVDQSVNAIGAVQRTTHEATNRFRFLQEQLKMLALYLFPNLALWAGLFAEKFALFIERNSEAFKEIGDYLTRLGYHLNKVVDRTIAFFDKWGALTRASKELIIFSTGVAAIAIPLLGILVIFTRALTVAGLWVAIFLTIALVLQDIYAVMQGGNGYFREFLNYMNWTTDDVWKFVEGMAALKNEFISTIKSSELIRGALAALITVTSTIWHLIIDDIVPAIQTLWRVISSNNVLMNLLSAAYHMLLATLAILGLIVAVFNGDIISIGEHFRNLISALKNMFLSAIFFIVGLFYNIFVEVLPQLIRGLFSLAMTIVGEVLRAIINAVVTVFGIIFKIVGSIFKFLWNNIRDGAISAFEAIKFIIMEVIDLVVKAFNKITGLVDKVKDFGGSVVDWVGEKASGATNFIKGFIPKNPFEVPVYTADAGKGFLNLGSPRFYDPGAPLVVPSTTMVTSSSGDIASSPTSSGVQVNISGVTIPINVPDTFTGDSEELRNLVAEVVPEVLAEQSGTYFDEYNNYDGD